MANEDRRISGVTPIIKWSFHAEPPVSVLSSRERYKSYFTCVAAASGSLEATDSMAAL